MNRKKIGIVCLLAALALCLSACGLKPGNGGDSSGAPWRALYRDFVMNKEYEKIGYPMYLPDGYEETAMSDGSVKVEYTGNDYDPIWFALRDMDGDGTPELLAFNGYGYMAGNTCHVYSVRNGELAYLGTAGRRELLLQYDKKAGFPGLVETDGNQGYYETWYWYIEGDRTVAETIESVSYYSEGSDYPDRFDSGEGPIVTRETANDRLYSWYKSAQLTDLGSGWQYREISEKGWDAFVNAMSR